MIKLGKSSFDGKSSLIHIFYHQTLRNEIRNVFDYPPNLQNFARMSDKITVKCDSQMVKKNSVVKGIK